MANSAILAIRIVGDAANAVAAFDKTQSRMQAMQRSFDVGAKAAAGALALLTAAAFDLAGAASEAQQAAGAVESVFKAEATAIKGYAEEASQAVGLSAQSYNTLASVLGAQLTNMGLAGRQLSNQTNDLIGMGADLAATFGGTTADAVGALSSLLRGERDPIERYGVSIKQADIDARKAAMGLADLTGEAERNADMQATLAILTEQTAAASGQFARESDTAAGAQQRMTAEWDNARAQLGEALLPILTELATMLGDAARWAADNEEAVRGLAIGIGVFSAALVVAKGAQIALNVAMKANPIGLLITALAGAAAGIGWVASNWEDVTAAFKKGGDFINDVFQGIADFFAAVFGPIIDGIEWIVNAAGDVLGIGGEMAVTTRMAERNAPAPKTSASGPAAGAGSSQQSGNVTNITIQGAIDKDGTARQIAAIVGDRSQRSGSAGRGTQWR